MNAGEKSALRSFVKLKMESFRPEVCSVAFDDLFMFERLPLFVAVPGSRSKDGFVCMAYRNDVGRRGSTEQCFCCAGEGAGCKCR